MMKLLIPLFSPPSGTWGGLTRVTAVARAAQQAGHSVAFCAAGALEESLIQQGFQVYPLPPSTFFGLPKRLSQIIEKRSQHFALPIQPGKSAGDIWLVLSLAGLARTSYLRQVVAAEQNAVQEFGADALFTDLDPGAFLLSRISGLPLASTYATVLNQGKGSRSWKWMTKAIGSVLQTNGFPPCEPDELFFNPSVAKIVPSIPELEEIDPKRRDVHFVGQLLGEIQPEIRQVFRPEPGKRYVYVYVGTGSVSIDLLRKVLPKVFPAEGKTICMVGSQSVTQSERVGGVIFQPYVPAEAILPYTDWTLCHGGQNTIMQSLRAGVPLILFPGPIFERRYNAQKVEENGAGIMGELNQFTPEWLGAALKKQIGCRESAIVLARKIRTLGGAPAAVKTIEALQAASPLARALA